MDQCGNVVIRCEALGVKVIKQLPSRQLRDLEESGYFGCSVDELMKLVDETQQVIEYSQQLESKSQQLQTTARQLRDANERLRKDSSHGNAANRDTIEDPDRIFPGQSIKLPAIDVDGDGDLDDPTGG